MGHDEIADDVKAGKEEHADLPETQENCTRQQLPFCRECRFKAVTKESGRFVFRAGSAGEQTFLGEHQVGSLQIITKSEERRKR